jgi:stress-induced morphogen
MTITKSKILDLVNASFSDVNDEITLESPRQDDNHFSLTIKSAQFDQLTLIQRSRLVYKILDPLLASKELHAISLNLIAQNNDNSRYN